VKKEGREGNRRQHLIISPDYPYQEKLVLERERNRCAGKSEGGGMWGGTNSPRLVLFGYLGGRAKSRNPRRQKGGKG